MMIIHILVDTLQVGTQDDNVTVDFIILYDPQQIYLHLLLQVHDHSKHLIQMFKYINYDIHELLFMLRL